MQNKEILKHNGQTVGEINDSPGTLFGDHETYSRNRVDALLRALRLNSGYDWTGKVIACEGESLTGNAVMGYPTYVAEQTGATVHNLGIGGKAVFPDEAGASCDFRRRVSRIPANVDAIIIMGDCNSGWLADCTKAHSFKVEDWSGRWNLALDAIRKSFPTVPVFLVFEWAGPMNTIREHQVQHIPESLWRMANWHGMIFVNLATESPLNLRYADSVWGLTDGDHTHTNHEAMPLFADVIIRHLRQIPPPVWQGHDTIAIAEQTAEVQVGKTVKLTVTKTGDLSSRWTSDNMDVACVLGGVVYGMAPGTATITATTRNGNTARCVVTVVETATA